MNIEQELNAFVRENIDNAYTQKSEIWRSLLAQRGGYNTFNFGEMESFLSTSSREASGTGDMAAFNVRLKQTLDYITESLDGSLLRKVSGSKVGNPAPVTINNVTSNLAHLWNLMRVQDYIEHLYSLKARRNQALDVLEIGPGYGCGAHILISLGLVKSYTCVDLSENLGNSVFFLSRNHPDWRVNFCRSRSDLCKEYKNLNFVLASKFDDLKGLEFDAVLNTDSFGEMPARTAKIYIEKIHCLLRESGIFISMNGHRRGQYELVGLNKVSDFGYDKFKVNAFSYKKSFSSSMDDFGHLAVCERSQAPALVEAKVMDVLADLFAMGINKDIDWILRRLNSSSLDGVDFSRVADWDEALREGRINESDTICKYIKFVRGAITRRDFDMNVYQDLLDQTESPQAQYILRLCRLICGAEWGFWRKERLDKALTFLMSDLDRFSNHSKLKRIIFLYVRREHLKKKFFSRREFKLPLILRIRRIVESAIGVKR